MENPVEFDETYILHIIVNMTRLSLRYFFLKKHKQETNKIKSLSLLDPQNM